MVKLLFFIQKRNTVYRKLLSIVFLLEMTIVKECTSNQDVCPTVTSNRRNVSYFKVDIGKVSWKKARRECINKNSMLPVICNKAEEDTLKSFLTGNSAIWTARRNLNVGDWKWHDDQFFTDEDFISSPVNSSKPTHVALENGRYRAMNPLHKSYYICQFSGSECNSRSYILTNNGCFSPSVDETGTWFDARSQCRKLGNDGDLAILKDGDLVTLMGASKTGLMRSDRSYWIGLRSNTWQSVWNETGEEIEGTHWSKDTNASRYECISINASNGEWKSVNCSEKRTVICEGNATSSTSSSTEVARTKSSTTTVSTTVMSSTISSSLMSKRKINRPTMTSTSMSMLSAGYGNNSTGDPQSKVLLYSGLGVGLSIIIIICVVVIVLALRFNRKRQKGRNHSNDTKKSEQRRSRADESAYKPTNSPVAVPINTAVAEADTMRGVYAEIPLARRGQAEDGSKSQQPGIVYASLDFQKEQAKRTDPTKVGPMGDIYAMPDAKGRAVASPGSESTSHPYFVTSQGDVYALPVKQSK